MFNSGVEKMRKKYQENQNKLPRAFSQMATFADTKVMTQITLLLDRLQGSTGEEWAVVDLQPSLQQRLHTAIVEWRTDWTLPRLNAACLEREDVKIPEEFVVVEEKPVVKQEPVEEGEDDEDPMEED